MRIKKEVDELTRQIKELQEKADRISRRLEKSELSVDVLMVKYGGAVRQCIQEHAEDYIDERVGKICLDLLRAMGAVKGYKKK